MEQSKVELSIIVPVYNVEKYLEECLNSISRIKDINYEISIVNDGSPDNSQKIIDEFCKNNIRAKSFIKENGGISSARNYGLKRAKGEYIWFVDSDDFVDANEFEKFYSRIDKKIYDIIIGNYIRYQNKVKTKEVRLLEDKKIISGEEILEKKGEEILKNAYVVKNLYKKEFLENNKLYFEKNIMFEDQLFTILCLLKAKNIKYLDYHFYIYRIGREGSLTTSIDKKLFTESSFFICKKLLGMKKVINKYKCIKKVAINHYISYLKNSYNRNLEIEKEIFSLKGLFFFKLEKRYKIWRYLRSKN